MTSRGPAESAGDRARPRRVRLSAADRRAGIVRAARAIALRDGLDNVTLRSLGEELGVAGSLISHYFPAVDDLLAEAFAEAASEEIAEVFGHGAGDGSRAPEEPGDPVVSIAEVLRFAVDPERAEVNRLWIDAWHVGRRRPALHAEVVRQTDRWTEHLGALITRGVRTGAFRLAPAADAAGVAARIMAVVDGLTVQSTLRNTIGYDEVASLGFAVAEHELGLEPGRLGRGPSGPTGSSG